MPSSLLVVVKIDPAEVLRPDKTGQFYAAHLGTDVRVDQVELEIHPADIFAVGILRIIFIRVNILGL